MNETNKTKIVCTIGPSTAGKEMLLRLFDAGMSVARLNGSHATLDWHKSTIELLRATLPSVPILLDIPGKKIRTTQLKVEPSFQRGDVVVFTTDLSEDGSLKVPVNYSELHNDLKPGQTILADDGTLQFKVIEIKGKDILCEAESPGKLRSRKGINVPYVTLKTPLLTDRDKQMILFACNAGIDYIGLSFVESREHIEKYKEHIAGSSPRIIAKIENQRGLDNMEGIIQAADAIMIDRGDLSVETSLFDVAINQKRIIRAANLHGCPVIVATEMLHSMIDNPYPTKAEVSDITNAVLDGCDAIMLSGETAFGAFPIESVRLMYEVARAAEGCLRKNQQLAEDVLRAELPMAISHAISHLCETLPISKIVAITRSGYAAKIISSFRPSQPILAVSDDFRAAMACNLISGVSGIYSESKYQKDSVNFIQDVLESLWRNKYLSEEDIILVCGLAFPVSGNRMNSLQVHKISELSKLLKWK